MRSIFVLGVILLALITAGCVSEPGSNLSTPTVSTTLPPSTIIGSSSPTVTPILPTSFPTLPTTAPENISVNWAGYVVETNFDHPESDSIEAVEATWNVPMVDCTKTNAGDYSSAFWIGIDGFSSTSVEQIGTDSDCIQGSPVYYSWYEMYPKDSVTLNMTLNPGDEVHAKISYLGGQEFSFSLTDTTNNQSVSITESSTLAERNSAEWIAEAPVYRHRILPLSDFGPVDFFDASVTVHGITGGILNDHWQYQSIVMESPGGLIKATPSGLLMGDNFSIIWEHQ